MEEVYRTRGAPVGDADVGDISVHRVSLDIETFSSVDLSRGGVYRYAEAADFQVLLIGYSFDGGPVAVVDLAAGEAIPPLLLSALLSPAVEKWAFNASFERMCLSRLVRDLGYLEGGCFLSPASWRCTMVWSAYLGLPMSLAGVGDVLNLEKKKLESGKELIRFFCTPAAPSLVNFWGNRNTSFSDPNKWKLFKAYNARDVETEMGIQDRLRGYPVPDSVWAEYELDQEINDRGIRVDLDFVSAAEDIDQQVRIDLTRELKALSGISNPNSVEKIREWLSDHGQETENLSKAEVRTLLQSAPPDVREVLLLRQQLSKTSVRKYRAMEKSVCLDGRVRGMFQFYGAQRSGRWAGRNVQLQNLPQNHIPELEDARSLVLAEDYSVL